MDNTREKLIEICRRYDSTPPCDTCETPIGSCSATEQAYKNGYQAALDSITHCKACAGGDKLDHVKGMVWCERMCRYMKEDDFCSLGEKKTDG